MAILIDKDLQSAYFELYSISQIINEHSDTIRMDNNSLNHFLPENEIGRYSGELKTLNFIDNLNETIYILTALSLIAKFEEIAFFKINKLNYGQALNVVNGVKLSERSYFDYKNFIRENLDDFIFDKAETDLFFEYSEICYLKTFSQNTEIQYYGYQLKSLEEIAEVLDRVLIALA